MMRSRSRREYTSIERSMRPSDSITAGFGTWVITALLWLRAIAAAWAHRDASLHGGSQPACTSRGARRAPVEDRGPRAASGRERVEAGLLFLAPPVCERDAVLAAGFVQQLAYVPAHRLRREPEPFGQRRVALTG